MKMGRLTAFFERCSIREGLPLLWGILAIAAFQLTLGLYAVTLNELFYSRFGPFYDSLSYYNRLALMQGAAQRSGHVAAFLEGAYASTVVYPWLVFAPFARSVSLFRGIGTWIQIFAAGWMQLAMFYYFLQIKGRPWAEAFAFSAVFVLIAASFDINGGLSDFRMDLLQYLLFATMLAVYAIARVRNIFWWWALFGLSAGLLCLGRATSPVYLVPLFAILATIDFITDWPNRVWILLRWLLAGIVVCAVAGWYFVSNFRYLYYYYAVWNEAATARNPLSESIGHVGQVPIHVGRPLLWALAFVAALLLAFSFRDSGAARIAKINWRPLLFSAVPLSYLVISGSGVNPFVSIVAVAGLIFFLLDPIADDNGVSTRLPALASLLMVTMLAVAGFVNAARAVQRHSGEAMVAWMPQQKGVRAVLDAITEAANKAGGQRTYRYGFVHLGVINQDVVFNAMVFDRKIPPPRQRQTFDVGQARIAEASVRNNSATEVDWMQLPGKTDEQKISGIVGALEEKVDFLVTVPTGDQLLPYVFIARFVPEITRRVMSSGHWEQIAGPIEVSQIERVIILRNLSRSGE
jgi:hypothetical protein